MKTWTIACLAAAALLTACSSDPSTGSADGTGGTAGSGAGGAYGAGGAGGGIGRSGSATPGSQEDLVQSAGDRVYFETDQARLTEEARGVLNRQAAWMQRNPQVSVWVAGNCDERGTVEYNLALGQRRAGAARDYLVAQGIAPQRIETISFGKDRPVDSGSTPEAWAHNRNAITSVK